MFSFHLSFLTSLITNPVGLQLSLRALPELRTLSSAGISKICYSMTNSLENMFRQTDVSKTVFFILRSLSCFQLFLAKAASHCSPTHKASNNT